MKKFVNHVDHVVYVSHYETVDANVAHLENVTGAKMDRCERTDLGLLVCLDWSAGLEIVAPLPERSEANAGIYDHLATRGEGLLAVAFGVPDLEAHKANLEAKGFEVGPLMSGDPTKAFYDRLFLRERIGPSIMGSMLVFAEIDYDDDVIQLVDV